MALKSPSMAGRRFRGEHGVGAAVVGVDQIGADQAKGAEQTRVGRHDDPPQRDQLEQGGQEHGTGGAECDEAEVAGIDATADGDVEDALGDVVEAHPPGVLHPLGQAQVGVEGFEGGAGPGRSCRGILPSRKRSPARMPISRAASLIVGRTPPCP